MAAFRVIEGYWTAQERAALSFVHPLGRLDVSRNEIAFVEARETFSYEVDRRIVTFDRSHVVVELDRKGCDRLRSLTRKILISCQPDKTLEIRVGDRCVARPVLVEVIGWSAEFYINVWDFEDAQALALKLQSRGIRPRLTTV